MTLTISPSSCATEQDLLGRYADIEGHSREVVALPGALGSVLVVDRDASTLGDRRLVAHLASDEPAENAALVCSRYLQPRPLEPAPHAGGSRDGAPRRAGRNPCWSANAAKWDGADRSPRTRASPPPHRWQAVDLPAALVPVLIRSRRSRNGEHARCRRQSREL